MQAGKLAAIGQMSTSLTVVLNGQTIFEREQAFGDLLQLRRVGAAQHAEHVSAGQLAEEIHAAANADQARVAKAYIAQLDQARAFKKPIVTTIEPMGEWYPAEDYHQEYYQNNKNTNPYCSIVIRPKLEKFQKVFANKLKKEL